MSVSLVLRVIVACRFTKSLRLPSRFLTSSFLNRRRHLPSACPSVYQLAIPSAKPRSPPFGRMPGRHTLHLAAKSLTDATHMTQTSSNAPESSWHATTILTVRKGGRVVIAGDGQVSLGQTIIKSNARKVRQLGRGDVIGGFAGATADAFT